MSDMRQPFYLTTAEAPELPAGWRYRTTADATVQLKPGKLYDIKTVGTTGDVPVVNQSIEGYLGWHLEEPGVLATPDRPVVTFANHTCAMRLMMVPFSSIQNIFPKIGRDGICDTTYFYYAANGRISTTEYKGHHPRFREALIPIPPLSTQLKIVNILRKYDELIEVNCRNIALLEEVSRALFEEWFVHFRFPGHETAAVTEGTVGLMPDDWRLAALSDTGTILTGKTPTKARADFFGGDTQFIKIPDMIGKVFVNTSIDSLTDLGVQSQANKTVPRGSICVSCIGTIGIVAITSRPSQTNQQINTIVPSSPTILEFLYHSVLRLKAHLINLGLNGATMGNVNKSKFAACKIAIPPQSLLLRYHEAVGSMFRQIEALSSANALLAESRDLLLPRLISGELTVTAAERELEPA